MLKQPITVKEVRQILAEMPQDAPVFMMEIDYDTGKTDIYPMVSGDIRVDYAMETINPYYPYILDDEEGELKIVLIG